MSYHYYSKEIRNGLYLHGKDMAERVLNACNRVLSGECESAACREENVNVLWIRKFVRNDIGIQKDQSRTINPQITKKDWYAWQDCFLTELNGEEWYAPDGFDELFEECITKACTEREQRILKMRYQEEMKLEDVGKEFNLTRERIRSIQVKALRKLRTPKYRLLLTYGREYHDAVMEQSSAQAEYDKARLIRMDECAKEREKAIAEHRKAANELKKQTEDLPNLQIEGIPEIENIPIEEMDLSVRSYNALQRNHYSNANGKLIIDPIDTVGKLSRLTRKELMKIRNLGKKCVNEIERTLEEKYEIKLKEE